MLVRGRWLRNSPCGLKHARHPLATGQGQTRPALRASDANKAPTQRPPQPFSVPLVAVPHLSFWLLAHLRFQNDRKPSQTQQRFRSEQGWSKYG